jgi:enoyl-CoA hydratase/carnithine racemase
MTDFSTLRYEVADGVATITLDRPDKRNALNVAGFEELGDAAEQASRDVGVRAVLIRGEGPSFCAGIDVTVFVELAPEGKAAFHRLVRTAQRPYLVLATMPKPVVAAVQGHALGAGFQLALAADIRVAAEGVSFGMLELNFGIVPDLGGNHRLTALVGPARAKELIWTARRVDAAEADRLGLANRIVATDALDGGATQLAAKLAAGPPLPIAWTKSIVDHAAESGFEASLERERMAQSVCLGSDDNREAVTAWFEKRSPSFSGS